MHPHLTIKYAFNFFNGAAAFFSYVLESLCPNEFAAIGEAPGWIAGYALVGTELWVSVFAALGTLLVRNKISGVFKHVELAFTIVAPKSSIHHDFFVGETLGKGVVSGVSFATSGKENCGEN